MLRRFALLSILVGAVGCDALIGADFDRGAGANDGGSADDGSIAAMTSEGGVAIDDSGSAQGTGSDAHGSNDGSMTTSNVDGSIGNEMSCRPVVVPCLDPSAANVIEVPTESTMQDAVTNAKAGDTIQIKGAMLGSGWKIPAYTTLHGCSGASIAGTISAAGSGATFEGFEVSGSIVLNQTGVYVVHWNVFDGTTTDPGVSPRSIDSLVSAQVTVTIEENEFKARPAGISVATEYDTMTHQVDLTAQNNIFHGVASPIVLSRGGLVGKVTAKILHNTFYDYGDAIGLYAMQDAPTIAGNVFMKGTNAVAGDSAWNSADDLLFMSGAGNAPPLGGSFATGDPKLVDPANGNVHLGAGSEALDRVASGPNLPAHDFADCPRPRGHGGTALGDIGAYEEP